MASQTFANTYLLDDSTTAGVTTFKINKSAPSKNIVVSDAGGFNDSSNILGDTTGTDAITVAGLNNSNSNYYGVGVIGSAQGVVIYDPSGKKYYLLTSQTFSTGTTVSAAPASSTTSSTQWVLDGGVAPSAPTFTITDNVAPVLSLSSGGSTNDTTPTLSGTSVAGGTIKVYNNGALLGTTATASDGSWSFTPTLAQGSYSLTATATNSAGTSTSAATSAYTFTVDTVAPAQPGVGTVDTLLSAADVADGETYTFTAEAGSTLAVSFASTSTTLPNLVATAGSTTGGITTYSVTLTSAQLASLGQGGVNYSAIATDAAGNASAAKTGSFTIDTDADVGDDATIAITNTISPAATQITVPGLDANTTGTVVFLVNGVAITVPGNPGTVTGNGNFTVDLSGFVGQDVQVTMSLVDTAGNTADAAGETEVICFYPGTLVATPDGQRAVETLVAGDLVLTAEGEARPIRWMGLQTVSRVFGDPLKTLPIRIAAGALGDNLPVRDLLVSPAHALLLDGVLVQAGALVNGTSITREHNVPASFTYYHIELADQSLILAEGVPAETFIDNASREAFDNWAEHPALEAPMAELALPRAMAHRQVPMATRQRIAARAAALFAQDSAAA